MVTTEAARIPLKAEPVEVKPEQSAKFPADKVAVDPLGWSELAFELELDSVARQIALNCIVRSYKDHQLQLAFLPELDVMLKPETQRQIKQAIEHKLGVSLKLEFIATPSLEVETPHQAEVRKLEQQRQEVIRAIHQDPVVQQLKTVFNAVLIEDSVKKPE